MKYLPLLLLLGCGGSSASEPSSPQEVKQDCSKAVAELADAKDGGARCEPSKAKILAKYPDCKLVFNCDDGGAP